MQNKHPRQFLKKMKNLSLTAMKKIKSTIIKPFPKILKTKIDTSKIIDIIFFFIVTSVFINNSLKIIICKVKNIDFFVY